LGVYGKLQLAFADGAEAGGPLAIAAIEDENRVAFAEAQDVLEVIGLGGRAVDPDARRQIAVDE
jgi:hypothetical protein